MDNAYVALVKKLAATGDPEIISNGSIEHAAALMTEMFALGKGKACILSGSLNQTLYGREEFIGALGGFLGDERSSVQVLLQEESGRQNAQLLTEQISNRFGSGRADRISFRLADEIGRAKPYHFATVGEKFFRFELDRTKHEAFASFGRPEHVKQLSQVFSDHWQKASDITIQPSCTHNHC
jgi:hypothetical protein